MSSVCDCYVHLLHAGHAPARRLDGRRELRTNFKHAAVARFCCHNQRLPLPCCTIVMAQNMSYTVRYYPTTGAYICRLSIISVCYISYLTMYPFWSHTSAWPLWKEATCGCFVDAVKAMINVSCGCLNLGFAVLLIWKHLRPCSSTFLHATFHVYPCQDFPNLCCTTSNIFFFDRTSF